MSFFSRSSGSSKGIEYKKANHGSSHYQRKGVFGNLFNLIVSKTDSGGYYDRTPKQENRGTDGNARFTNCSGCGTNIPEGANFCFNCGSRVPAAEFCSSCGERVPAGSKFCLKCGNRLHR